MRYRALMLAGGLALMLVVVMTVVLGAGAAARPAAAQPAPAVSVAAASLGSGEPISRAVAWLATQQDADGGFGGAGVTADVVIGMAGANLEPRLMRTITGTTPIAYLVQEGPAYAAGGPGEAAKLALALVAADVDPYDLGGLDLIDGLWESYSGTLGVFVAGWFTATTTSDQALAMLAVAAVQETVPTAAVSTLASWQLADGSWAWNPAGTFGDPDSTGLALMALLASGRAHTLAVVDAIEAAEEYLRSDQLADGGWGWGSASADSTGVVIQALAALGYVPTTWTWVTASGGNPQAALQGLQLAGGSFPDWTGAPNVMATAHALPGLAEAPLPVLGRQGMARRGLTWLAERQNDDGGFGSPGSSPGGTAEVIFAFGAAGMDVNTVRSARGMSPLGFLATQVPTYSHDGGEIGKLVLAAVAGDGDPRSFGGYDLVISLTNQISASGQLNTNSNFKQAMGMLALEAAGEAIPVTVTQWLKVQQLSDGGWEWAAGCGWGSDPDTTAIAIQALVAAGEPVTATAVFSAVNYLHALQNDDAGFPSGFDPASNSNSTAYAIQALLAAGENLMNDEAGLGLVWVRNGRTPINALRSFQKSDGPFVYEWGGYFGPTDNLAATYQGVPALLGRYHPIKTVATASGSAEPESQAGLVVDYGDGRYDAVCVALNESPITGLELLDLSGISYEATEAGLVVGIGDTGCPASNPWCAPPYYWSYLAQDAEGAWQPYLIGAGESQIVSGSVDGWRWVDWNALPAPVPALSPVLANLCASNVYAPVYRGPDPDRLVTGSTIVTATVRAAGEGTVDVRAAFGSDLDRDASAGLEYRPSSGGEWLSVELVRADGVFTAQLSIENPDDYEFSTTFSDPDGLRAQLRIYLPLALRGVSRQ